MTLARRLVLALRSLLAMVLAFAAVYAVNMAGAGVAELTRFPWGGERRLLWDLGWVFVAGVAATVVAVGLAPAAPRVHAVAFFVLALAIDVAAVAQFGGDWPVWFSAGILSSLPLQVWLGASLVLRRGARKPVPEP